MKWKILKKFRFLCPVFLAYWVIDTTITRVGKSGKSFGSMWKLDCCVHARKVSSFSNFRHLGLHRFLIIFFCTQPNQAMNTTYVWLWGPLVEISKEKLGIEKKQGLPFRASEFETESDAAPLMCFFRLIHISVTLGQNYNSPPKNSDVCF